VIDMNVNSLFFSNALSVEIKVDRIISLIN
jgi:hypothetical protein